MFPQIKSLRAVIAKVLGEHTSLSTSLASLRRENGQFHGYSLAIRCRTAKFWPAKEYRSPPGYSSISSSPSARFPNCLYSPGLIVLVRNCVEPSANVNTAPPTWKLPKPPTTNDPVSAAGG